MTWPGDPRSVDGPPPAHEDPAAPAHPAPPPRDLSALQPSDRFGPATPVREPRRPRGPLLHAVLFVITAMTLTLAGGMWVGVENLGDLWRAEVLIDVAARGWGYAFWVLAILGAHEMGHYLACRYYGIAATLPFFIPGIWPIGSFGAVIRIRGPIPHRKALFDIAAAGPIAGFVIALPVMLAGLAQSQPVSEAPAEGAFIFGPPMALTLWQHLFVEGRDVDVGLLFIAGWVGMLVTSLNLFPVGQLDGGHAIYAISRRAHRITAWITLAGLLALIVAQAIDGKFPSYVLWFVILAVMRDRHPRLLDESQPLGGARIAVAVALLVIFVLSFIPVPFTVL